MATVNGKLTKIGKNDFGGIIIQLDGSMEISVWEDKAAYAGPYLASLRIMSVVSIPVVGYKGKTQLDMAVVGEPESAKGTKFINGLKKFYNKRVDADDELAPPNGTDAAPDLADRG